MAIRIIVYSCQRSSCRHVEERRAPGTPTKKCPMCGAQMNKVSERTA